ncbi:MAG TPA: ATP-binding protein [Coleofasciculaceae cyanobacterium]
MNSSTIGYPKKLALSNPLLSIGRSQLGLMIQRKRTEGEIRQALAQEKELLDNLLSNAIKYSPAGSNVRLTLHRSV